MLPQNNPGTAFVDMSWTEPAETISNAEPISVSGLLQRAKLALERCAAPCAVSGEISGFKRAASGHCYFDLKDDAAQIACVLYRNQLRWLDLN